MSDLSKVVILIPSFEPDEKLPKLLNDLQGYPFEKILIVNDGSDKKFDTVFDECRAFPKVEVIGYEENRGKGFALKKGFRYIQEHYPDFKAIVTADSDGQHTPEDIRRTAQTTLENPEKLILGSRSWKEENVPFRSRYGNKITKAVFKWISGTKVEDTQTGLRGFSPDVVSEFLKTKGDRFEYEMNMLMEARLRHIEILEIPIETVYIEENKSSHFRPFRDSVKIYSVFFKHLSKFVISSMSATVIDFAIYAIMLNAVFGYTEENKFFGQPDRLQNSYIFHRCQNPLLRIQFHNKQICCFQRKKEKPQRSCQILCNSCCCLPLHRASEQFLSHYRRCTMAVSASRKIYNVLYQLLLPKSHCF